MKNKIAILSNILLCIGVCVLLYKVVVLDHQKNKKIEESYRTIHQLSTAIIIYNKEPNTVMVLAGEIIRNANIEDIKKEEDLLNVCR